MPMRRIVIFDEIGRLAARVEQALLDHRFELVRIRCVDRLVETLREGASCLILIAVEASTRAGFTAFTRTRRALAQPPPILLFSESLSREEFAVHAKQRWSAAAYLDLGALDADALRKEIGRHVRLGSRRKGAAITSSRGRRARSKAPARASGASGEEPAARPPRSASSAAERSPAGEPKTENTAAELERARAEVRRLQQELEEARRYVSTSPFSETFLELRGQLEASEARRQQLARDLSEQQTARDELQDELAELTVQLEHREERERELRMRETALEAALAEAQHVHEQTRHQAQASLEREQLRHRDALERVRHEQRAALEAARQRAAAEAAALQSRARDVEQTLAQRHAAELEALHQHHELERTELEQAFEKRRLAEREELETELQTLERLLALEPEERAAVRTARGSAGRASGPGPDPTD